MYASHRPSGEKSACGWIEFGNLNDRRDLVFTVELDHRDAACRRSARSQDCYALPDGCT
jgi:hypothetical protein